ncbi:MAG: TlpA family protein disulfide reductase [Thermoguttaceae bacterium]|nr:TlpA family protein disulfide reductase [Thermoguttaceae bacterium]
MRLTNTILGAAALALALFAVSSDASVVVAQEDEAGVATSGNALDMSLFDVPDGKDAKFYRDRQAAIQEALNALSNPDEATISKINEVMPKAFLVIFKNLANDAEADEEERDRNFNIYAMLLGRTGEVEELEKLIAAEKAKDEPNKERIDQFSFFALLAKIEKADKDDASALKAVADELVDKAMAIDIVAYQVSDLCEALGEKAPDLASETLDKIADAFTKSNDKIRKKLADGLLGKKRMAELVGNEVVLEGLFLDGKEIDWKSYRGKVVLIDVFATWCGPCMGEVPGILKNYERFHEAGFDVISYSVDQDLDALKKYEETEKHPWKTASETLAAEQTDADGNAKYKSFSDYYGIDAIPRMILVDKDGKAIDTNARGDKLTKALEKLFPNVK